MSSASRRAENRPVTHAVPSSPIRRAPSAKGKIFLVNVSGRGDKDIDIYRENFKELDNHFKVDNQ